MESNSASQRALYTVSEFVALPEFNFLSESALRHLIFASRSTVEVSGAAEGLAESGAIVRMGRKVLVDAARFRSWLSGKTPATH